MTSDLIRIGDVCQVGDGTHSTIARQDSGVMYLTSRNLKNGGIDLSKLYYISEQDYARHFSGKGKALTKPKAGDLIFSIIGSLGEPYLMNEGDLFGISSSVAIVRPDIERLDSKFLFYWVKGPTFQNALHAIRGGVAQGYVSLEMIRSLPVPRLPLESQKTIGSLLGDYDELIENNQRRVRILEEMARGLYRDWFVHFRFPGHENHPRVQSEVGEIPQGWNTKPVGDCVAVNPRVAVPRVGEKPFIPMSSLSNDSMLVSDIEIRGGNSGSKFQVGDTLFARITPCLENGKTGFVSALPKDSQVGFGSTEFIVLRGLTVSPEYVYCLARSEAFREHAIKSMTGATGRQRVQEASFAQFYLAEPPRSLSEQFSTIVAPAFKLIHSLHRQIANLRKTRDLLLPRLLSGQIKLEAN